MSSLGPRSSARDKNTPSLPSRGERRGRAHGVSVSEVGAHLAGCPAQSEQERDQHELWWQRRDHEHRVTRDEDHARCSGDRFILFCHDARAAPEEQRCALEQRRTCRLDRGQRMRRLIRRSRFFGAARGDRDSRRVTIASASASASASGWERRHAGYGHIDPSDRFCPHAHLQADARSESAQDHAIPSRCAGHGRGHIGIVVRSRSGQQQMLAAERVSPRR